jgi:drug/metabolite transporter (DMT)-like permease
LLMTLGIVWGGPYFLIRIAVADYHPVIVAFGRAFVGAAIMIPLAHKRDVFAAGFRNIGWVALYTVAELSGPWVLIGYSEKHVTSSTAGLIIALTPTLAAAFAMIKPRRTLSLRQTIGLVAGVAGVAALVGIDPGQPHWLAFMALMLSAVGYALGPMIVARKLSDQDATGVVVASLILAALFYLPFVPAHWPTSFSLQATVSIVTLGALCTAFAFMMLFSLIAEAGAARATLVAYINPAVAVLLGVLVLDEPFGLETIVGFLLIAIGTSLATHDPTLRSDSNTGLRAASEPGFVASVAIGKDMKSP